MTVSWIRPAVLVMLAAALAVVSPVAAAGTPTTSASGLAYSSDNATPHPSLTADRTVVSMHDAASVASTDEVSTTETIIAIPNTTISGGAVTWLHHDQLGSTRLLTNTSGTTIVTVNYDPTTAQFLSVDPLAASTHQPYSYSDDTPTDATDPSGLDCHGFNGCGLSYLEAAANGATFGLPGHIDEAFAPGSTCTYDHDNLGYKLLYAAGTATSFAYGAGELHAATEGIEAADTGGSALARLRTVASGDRGSIRIGGLGDGGIEGATGSVGKLADQFGYTTRQIRTAIHSVKRGSAFPGNPDVVIDRAGEVYPVGPDGVAGDSIGNILDHLGG